MSTHIHSLQGHRIWDSRGRPTVEVQVRLHDGSTATGIAPAGASRGTHEAVDLRDGGAAHGGLGVNAAVAQVNSTIAPALLGLDAAHQALIDRTLIVLDGTPNKSRLGGNAIVATSMAVLKAAAAAAGQPVWRHLCGEAVVKMPVPQVQIFGGAAHSGGRLSVQDFMVMPVGARSFDGALSICADIYRSAGTLMAERRRMQGVTDEGGWWPDFANDEEALDTLALAIERAGHVGRAQIALDVAASGFGAQGRYRPAQSPDEINTDAWLARLCRWVERYPIVSVEDPVAEDDTAGMQAFTRAMGHRLQIVGDDYLVTQAARVANAVAQGCGNALLAKVNQAGTVTEAHAAVQVAQDAGWAVAIAGRSGESEDTLVAHLAVGWGVGQLKVGGFSRSERMAKYNECLRIERSLG